MIELKNQELFRFTEEGHIHEAFINGEWTKVPGCTSISGLFPDDGWKFAWPVKLMEEKALAGFKEYFISNSSDLFEVNDTIKNILKKAKNAWREKRDKASDKGKIAHQHICEFATNGTIPVIADEEVKNSFDEFLKWEAQYKPKHLACEIQVGSLKNRCAGILDDLSLISGKVTLVDYKTSESIKDDYAIQLAGLMICLEEQGVAVEQRAILHLPKKGQFEYRVIESDLSFEKEAFLAGVEFYRYKNLFSARCKND